MTVNPTPAHKLSGLALNDGWTVGNLIPKGPNDTGGFFSVGYYVNSGTGEVAFLKALDLVKLISPGDPDPTKKISQLTSGFVYERDLLKQCRDAKLRRVIRSLSDGDITVDHIQVPYIIFELASSDLRRESGLLAQFDLAWVMRTMHHTAVGVNQLHKVGIAHQDLKPSNILITQEDEKKIGDLGRCATKSCTLEHMDLIVAGDYNHAPLEGLYGYTHPEWNERRNGCDIYQLGSLLVFMITGLPATAAILQHLKQDYRPGIWGGSYAEGLPYLIGAFNSLLAYIDPLLPDNKVKQEILTLIGQLCNPDIDNRGDPIKRGMKGNPFNLERVISQFDRIATALERNLA